MFMGLLKHDKPVLGILKRGEIHFNILTVFEDDIENIAKAVNEVYYKVILK